jgi:chorismate mutase
MDGFREQIDKIDGEIFRLFGERMDVVRQIALYKKEHCLPVRDAAREREKLAAHECPYAQKLCAALMEISREYQESMV